MKASTRRLWHQEQHEVYIYFSTFLFCVHTHTYTHRHDYFKSGGVYFHQDIQKCLIVSLVVMLSPIYMHYLAPLPGFIKALDTAKWSNSIILWISVETLYREATPPHLVIQKKKSKNKDRISVWYFPFIF